MIVARLSAVAAVIGAAALLSAGPAAAWHHGHGYRDRAPAYGYYDGPPRFSHRRHDRWRYWRHHRPWWDRPGRW